MMRTDELKTIIHHSAGEGDAQRYFEKYPEVLAETLFSGSMSRVVSQFRMGDEYVPDFVLAQGFSGGWLIKLVELEPPDVPIFTKAGVPADRYRQAMKQVEDWKRYIDRNKRYFLERLSAAIQSKDLHNTTAGKGMEPVDSVGWKMTHEKSGIIVDYVIVISNWSILSDDDISRKAGFARQSFETMTYDRFLPVAERCDEYSHIYE